MNMKRILSFLTVVSMAAVLSLGASAQNRFGVMAGLTSSSASLKDISSESVSRYHAGVFMQIPLAAGFSFQPALLYQVKGASLDELTLSSESLKSLQTEVGYIELPLQLQWGPDLLLFRPYVLAEPFLGYAIATSSKGKSQVDVSTTSKSFKESGLSRLEYGLGLGGGVEIWRLQISAKYFWNFGSLYNQDSSVGSAASAVAETVQSAFGDKKSFNGIMFSLGLMF